MGECTVLTLTGWGGMGLLVVYIAFVTFTHGQAMCQAVELAVPIRI